MSDVHAVIVGAGFAALYMLRGLRQLGLSARVFEAGGRYRRHLVLEPLPRRGNEIHASRDGGTPRRILPDWPPWNIRVSRHHVSK